MALESVTNIDDLNAANPVVGDPVSEGDDHIRNIKTALTTDFPNIGGVMSATHTELNALYGVTAGTVTASKGLVVDSSSKLNTLNVDNIDLDGNTISTTDTNGDLLIAPNGTGDVDFDAIIRALNRLGYDGPLSVEWEDEGMDRRQGAAESIDYLQSMDVIPPNGAAFDAAFSEQAGG